MIPTGTKAHGTTIATLSGARRCRSVHPLHVLRKTNIERPDIGTRTSHLQGHANLTIQLPDYLPMESQWSRRLTNINDTLECTVPA